MVALSILRKRYPLQKTSIFSFFFIFSLSFPFLGFFLSFWLIYFFWHYKHEDIEEHMHIIDMDAFLIKFPHVKRQFGDGAIREMMDNERLPLVKKLLALTMLSEQKSKENMMTIKQMLSSKNDEIRLLSFATIDKLEYDIHKEIHRNKKILESDEMDHERRIKAMRALAFSYWELIYFELADEALKDFLLQKIKENAEEVIVAYPEDHQLCNLLGKVYFEQGKDEKSEKLFWKSIQLSSLKGDKKASSFIIPYIAEMNYNQRMFSKIKPLFKQVISYESHSKLRPIQELWSQHG
jgi:tetratricopeptide (TPR) repeat protein